MSDGRSVGRPGWMDQLRAALVHPLTSDGRLVVAGGATALTYAALILSTFPEFSVQLLARNPGICSTASRRSRERRTEASAGSGWG
ncbi:hypothetical protein SY89_01265 [Halolamina pelagica]|uniref:Uncharacterized protein n=1 Tax=Halolamina pelagica TaxID=699431 RepID=A0A0P7GPJ1_9EURY|nr:hypothetical protein [Halolamina pelagica]KPN30530.1 hypothetical protein SY89_01265 [Halolamina pelagica]